MNTDEGRFRIDDEDDEEDATRVSKFVRPPPPPPGSVPKASLVVVSVPSTKSSGAADLGRRIRIEKEAISIGRHESNTLLLDQDDISRRHAEVSLRNGVFYVRDLDSRNGTLVNDSVLRSGERPLVDGDRIQVGPTHLKFIQSETEDKFHEVIYKLKVEDALTRIHNKRYMTEFLEREVSRAARHRTALSLIMFDLDFFKQINDTWGHLAGDAVLREVAALVKSLARVEDCFARYGGEEFAFVVPGVPLQNAAVLAEKIRSCVESHAFIWNGHRMPVTVSLGAAELPPGETDLLQLIRLADEYLYEAKRGGRNCVVAR